MRVDPKTMLLALDLLAEEIELAHGAANLGISMKHFRENVSNGCRRYVSYLMVICQKMPELT